MLDNAVLFSLSANQDLAEKVAKILGVTLGERIIKKFPSGETIVEPVDTVRGKDVFIIQSTCPPVNENLMEVLIFIDALRRASAHEINLIVPYFGYARQDRKAKPRQPITAALVAHLLTTAGVDRVVTVNLHAAQEQGFFSCLVDDLTAVPLLGNDVIECANNCENVTVVSPDHGGVNRARDLAEMLDCPIAIIDKRRNNKLEPEVMNIIGEVKDRDCIMIDDMIDTCRSAIAGARALKANGAKSVRMMAVHAVLSDPCYDLLKEDNPFDSIIVSDSIPLQERFKELGIFRVVTLSTVIAETIDRIVNNVPLSGVYSAIGHKDSANS
ncbi:MAG: ribose-phosphate pyrophosphokinase [Bacilli bacterium]|nr:ribose-phosphate pyrophosphokinase [Bacilli bacterium]